MKRSSSPVHRWATKEEIESPSPDLLLNNLRKEGAHRFGLSLIKFPPGTIKWDPAQLSASKRRMFYQRVTPFKKHKKKGTRSKGSDGSSKCKGLFTVSILVEDDDSMTVSTEDQDETGEEVHMDDYRKMAVCKDFIGKTQVDLAEIISKFEDGSISRSPYCAELIANDFMQSMKFETMWNMNKLHGGILKFIEESPFYYNKDADQCEEIPGINTLMAYIGVPGTVFAIHKEDCAIISLHYLLEGRKIWITVPLSQTRRLWEFLADLTGDKCPAFQCHKSLFPSPELLKANGFHVCILEQNADDLIVSWEDRVHYGLNSAFTIGIATNFAQMYTIHHSFKSPSQEKCRCSEHSPFSFEVTSLIKRFYPSHCPLENKPASFFNLDPLDPHVLDMKIQFGLGTENEELEKFEDAISAPSYVSTVRETYHGETEKAITEDFTDRESTGLADNNELKFKPHKALPKKRIRKSDFSIEQRTCNLCGRLFANGPYFPITFKNHMERHKNQEDGIRPHKCNICNTTFLTQSDLTSHRSKEHKKNKDTDIN